MGCDMCDVMRCDEYPPGLHSLNSFLRSSYIFSPSVHPGEVYNVEIALDLKELNSITRQRQSLRGSLEKAIAYYEATNVRPEVFIQTGKV